MMVTLYGYNATMLQCYNANLFKYLSLTIIEQKNILVYLANGVLETLVSIPRY